MSELCDLDLEAVAAGKEIRSKANQALDKTNSVLDLADKAIR